MKCSLLLFVILFIANFSKADPSYPQPVEKIRWGIKTETSIEVKVWGDVAYEGTYHVPKGFGLKSILAVAGGLGWKDQRNHYAKGSGQFAGKIKIYRLQNGQLTPRFESKLRELQLASTPDQELKNGDIVRVPNIRLWEK